MSGHQEIFLHELVERSRAAGYSPYQELYESRNGKQRCLFVDCYVADPSSAWRAAQAAKYKGGPLVAVQLMKDDLIKAAIAEKMNERQERTRITQDRILQELAIIAFSNLEDYKIDPDTGFIQPREGMPEHVLRAISSVKFVVTVDSDGNERRETTVKLWDKVAALHLAGKHLGMFEEKLRLAVDVAVKQKWEVGGREIVF